MDVSEEVAEEKFGASPPLSMRSFWESAFSAGGVYSLLDGLGLPALLAIIGSVVDIGLQINKGTRPPHVELPQSAQPFAYALSGMERGVLA